MKVGTVKRDDYKYEKAKIINYIQKKLNQPLTHRVLQNFPSYSAFTENRADISEWLYMCSQENRDLHLYVAIPFCTDKGIDKSKPEKCGFCLLPTMPYSAETLNNYLNALIEHEIPMYAEYMGKSTSKKHPVDSIFLGGGTPNILTANLYIKLLSRFQDLFDIKQDAEITTEGTPELYTNEKIQIFRELGGTRISFGVQQFNEDLLPICGRKVSKDYTREMISYAIEKGLSVSIDLIYGWPDQTIDRLLSELMELHELGIHRITAYPLNVNGSCYFSTTLHNRLPGIDDVREMYMQSKSLLTSLGYTPVTLNDYEYIPNNGSRPHCLRHEEAMRKDHLSYRIGMGYAAVSKLLFHENGYGITYRNFFNREEGMQQYLNLLAQYQFPIDSHFIYTKEDLILNYISGSLHTFRIDLKDMQSSLFINDPLKEFAHVFDALMEFNWIEIIDDIVKVTSEGRFFLHIIQAAFFVKRVNVLKN